MAPRNKYTREEMVEAAVRVVREKGIDALTAKALAGELEEAYQLLAPFADVDAVIMALRTGRKKEARRMLEALPADSKEVERLREML